MMNLFAYHADRDKTELVIDIETSIVRALLVHYRHGAVPAVLACSSRALRLPPRVDFSQMWREIKNAVTTVANELVSESGVRPTRARCILAAPWYAAQVRTVDMSRETSFHLSRELISKIQDDEERRFQQHVREAFAGREQGVRMTERQLMQTRLNGYAVRHIEDKDVTRAELTFYYSAQSDTMHSLMGEILQNYAVPEHIQFHTFPFVAFQTLQHLLNTEDGFLFVHIGGEATELFSVAGGMVQDIASFLIGERDIARRAAHALRTTTESAESQLRHYAVRQLHDDAAIPIKTVIDQVSREWFGQLKNFFSVASRRCPVPQTIFFSADSPLTQTARLFLEQDYAKHFTILGKPFHVRVFTPRAMRQFVSFSRDFYPGDERLLFGVLASPYLFPHYANFPAVIA